MKKDMVINIPPISSSQGNSKGFVNEKKIKTLHRSSLLNKRQILRNTNIDLCAIGVNEGLTSPQYMPGDDCPNKCGGLFILLRHYTDVKDRLRFTDNSAVVEKMICDICAKQANWEVHR